MTTRDLAQLVAGGDVSAPYRLGQVVGFDFGHQPPVLYVDDVDRPMRFIGRPWDYAIKDVVVWLPSNGSPLVIGRLPGMSDDLEDWHLIGAGGEPAFQNSWVNFGSGHATAGFYLQPDGWVRLKGLLASGSSLATMFTLPEGYRPAYVVQVTGISNTQACTIEIDTSGNVTKTSGGTNAHVSLAGISFPTTWNRSQWLVPAMESAWSRASTANSAFEMFVRDDGWVYCKGAASGTDGTRIVVLPERTRTIEDHLLFADDVASIGYTRLNLSYKGVLTHNPGGALSAHFGGKNWFAAQNSASFFAASLLNSWANLGSTFVTAGYYKDHMNVCHLQGVVTGSNGSPILTLPPEYRPAEQHVFFTLTQGEDDSRVDVLANGDVQRLSGTNGYLSLNGVSFRAEQ